MASLAEVLAAKKAAQNSVVEEAAKHFPVPGDNKNVNPQSENVAKTVEPVAKPKPLSAMEQLKANLTNKGKSSANAVSSSTVSNDSGRSGAGNTIINGTTEKTETVVLSSEPVKIDANEFVYEGQSDQISQQALKEFREGIEILKAAFENPQLLSTAVANTVAHLRKYPYLRDNIYPEDMGLMVRALRQSRENITIVKSTEKTKRSDKKAQKDEGAARFAEAMGGFTL